MYRCSQIASSNVPARFVAASGVSEGLNTSRTSENQVSSAPNVEVGEWILIRMTSLLSLVTAINVWPHDACVPTIPERLADSIEGAQVNDRIRLCRRCFTARPDEKVPVFVLVSSGKCSSSASLTISRRSQLASSCGCPFEDQTERIKLAVRAARAHLRCFATPGGDHDMAKVKLAEISSPIEYMPLGAGSVTASSSAVNHGTWSEMRRH